MNTPSLDDSANRPTNIRVLGVRVDMLEIQDIVATMHEWIEHEPTKCRHVINSGMHGIIASRRELGLKSLFEAADLFAPDGILMVLVSRIRGFKIRKSRTGPELLGEFSALADKEHYSYFLLGDEPETLERLSSYLTGTFPGLRIVGAYSPPFRPLTTQENTQIIEHINQAQPDVLWVSMGMPKQEIWIGNHRDKLKAKVAVGAGASFKFLSGSVRRSPTLLRNSGFEWLWRLMCEPRRVWRRVFVDAPIFVALVAIELSGLKKFN